jgi:hypothetical protein
VNCMRCDYRLGYDCCHPANPRRTPEGVECRLMWLQEQSA